MEKKRGGGGGGGGSIVQCEAQKCNWGKPWLTLILILHGGGGEWGTSLPYCGQHYAQWDSDQHREVPGVMEEGRRCDADGTPSNHLGNMLSLLVGSQSFNDYLMTMQKKSFWPLSPVYTGTRIRISTSCVNRSAHIQVKSGQPGK